MLSPKTPALILAPMDGITDAPMRQYQGAYGVFTHAVTEFLRVSNHPIPIKAFVRDVPELSQTCETQSGLPVQVQILGGNPTLMAQSALNAVWAGAKWIDINFGCPAPTVNRNDGGASILKDPQRLFEITKAVREALPESVSVSVKMRLGWDSIESVYHNAEVVEKAGANWITIHARTKSQGYQPPVFWKPIGVVRKNSSVPIVANGDIWTLEDFFVCQEQTGCSHFMVGRPALARPSLMTKISSQLFETTNEEFKPDNWVEILQQFCKCCEEFHGDENPKTLNRMKQWLAIAARFGDFDGFDQLKRLTTHKEFFETLSQLQQLKGFSSANV